MLEARLSHARGYAFEGAHHRGQGIAEDRIAYRAGMGTAKELIRDPAGATDLTGLEDWGSTSCGTDPANTILKVAEPCVRCPNLKSAAQQWETIP